MVDVAARLGIDQRHAWLPIQMAREIGKLVGKDFKDRGVDLYSDYVPCTEKDGRKNVATATHANDGDVDRCLHEIGGIDDVVFQ